MLNNFILSIDIRFGIINFEIIISNVKKIAFTSIYMIDIIIIIIS